MSDCFAFVCDMKAIFKGTSCDYRKWIEVFFFIFPLSIPLSISEDKSFFSFFVFLPVHR